MKILLLFPPQAQPFLPHSALPGLKAYIEKYSAHNVLIRDINLEVYDHFFSRGLSPEITLNMGALKAALKTIRSGQDYFDPQSYYQAIEVIQSALGAITTKYPSIKMDLKNFTMTYSTSSSGQILQATKDHQANPFIEIFQTVIIPGILEEKPGLIGISVSWPSQIIPAMTLARLIKAAAPGLHITIGGSLITHIADLLAYKRKFFSYCNSFIAYEGEIPLLKLADALEKGLPFSTVPNLIYPEGKKEINVNAPQYVRDLSELPVPDFSDLPLEKYLTPLPYLPISASRGCYWNKCTFCSHAFSNSTFRSRPAKKVFEEMMALNEKTGTRHFYFVDDALPPRTAATLPRLIKDSGKAFYWGAEVRFEHYFLKSDFQSLAEGGCRFLLYGLESCCRDVLQAMNKGYRQEWVSPILRNAHEAGIINWVFLFLGFPGEQKGQAVMTMDFIFNNRQNIDMIAPGRFILTRHSPVFRNPALYGITRVEEPSMEYDMRTTFQFLQSSGIGGEEISEIMNCFRTKPEVLKFLKTFVAEVHLMFFRQSHLQDNIF
jgi:anaerobic magnesium-protoporphyrin IX monomethyl ester cyclase